MTTARRHLLDLLGSGEAFDQDLSELRTLQLQAVRDQFAVQRDLIPVLAKRADQAGIREIATLNDLIPLLFAHTVYKSYPHSFVEKNRWDRMLDWLNTLSAGDPRGIDVSGVTNADEWIARLGEHGHQIMATSGTSGKCSFLNAAPDDRLRKIQNFYHVLDWPRGKPDKTRHVFVLGPRDGPNSAVDGGKIIAELWAKDGGFHPMFEEPLRISDISALAAFSRRVMEGAASASEIENAQKTTAAKAVRTREIVAAYTDRLLAHRHEPVVICGLWSQILPIIVRAQELGIPDGDWHPDTRISLGGGVKGVSLPADYKERVLRFFGSAQHTAFYGMTEMAHLMPRCEVGRYHPVPGVIPLLLDGAGEKLVDATSEVVAGRFAFVDLTFDGRWGGLITGDRVEMDFSQTCRCGHRGPTLLDTITRFSQPGEDDHIGCAGTLDAYARGAIAA